MRTRFVAVFALRRGAFVAKRTVVELVDDLDGSKIEDGGAVRFDLRGVEYEVDLSADNTAKLDSALEPFVRVARRATPAAPSRTRRRKSTQQLVEIREWARANGHTVNDHGRVPEAVRKAYESAH